MKRTEREKFKLRLQEICRTYDQHGAARFALHDWDDYFDEGYRTSSASAAFDEALRCE